jgi:hypothetical protein
MCEILDKNYNNFLKNCNKFTTFDLDKQEKLNDSDDFIEYTDNNDNYIEPERKISNEWIDKRLFI